MARKQRTRTRTQRTARTAARRSAMVFSKINYMILTACVSAIIVGYTIMRLENEVDGFISLYISPIILILGYLGIFVAILYRPKTEEAGPQ